MVSKYQWSCDFFLCLCCSGDYLGHGVYFTKIYLGHGVYFNKIERPLLSVTEDWIERTKDVGYNNCHGGVFLLSL